MNFREPRITLLPTKVYKVSFQANNCEIDKVIFLTKSQIIKHCNFPDNKLTPYGINLRNFLISHLTSGNVIK